MQATTSDAADIAADTASEVASAAADTVSEVVSAAADAASDEEEDEEEGETTCVIAGITGTINSGKCEITQTLTKPSIGSVPNYNPYSYSLGTDKNYEIYIGSDRVVEEINGNINIYYYNNGNFAIHISGTTGNNYNGNYSGIVTLIIKKH